MLTLLLGLFAAAPAAAGPVQPAVALTPPAGWLTSEDYPAAALRSLSEGVVKATVRIDRTGAIAGCTVIESSGHELLDVTACALAKLRGRYRPARNAKGDPVDDVKTLRFAFAIPDAGGSSLLTRRNASVWAVRPYDYVTDLRVNALGLITDCRVSSAQPWQQEADDPCANAIGRIVAADPEDPPPTRARIIIRASLTIVPDVVADPAPAVN